MNLVYGDIQLTEEAYEELAREWREHGDRARGDALEGDGRDSGVFKGFESLATLLGIMPGIRRADERLQRQRAA